MVEKLTRAFAILALPTVVFLAGVWVMNEASDRQQVTAALSVAGECDRAPLNQRFGYDVAAVDRHWRPIVARTEAYEAERLFLELDLIFPILYGVALASSLLLARAQLQRPFHPVWAIAPVAIMVIADWTENLVQLSLLRHYATERIAALPEVWIHIASGATIVKLTSFFCVIVPFLVVLIILMLVRKPDRA